MAEIRAAVLFGKLNTIAYKALESSMVFCKMRGNPKVELLHWFYQLVLAPSTDLLNIIRHFGLDPSKLSSDLQASLDRLPRGASGVEGFSEQLQMAIERKTHSARSSASIKRATSASVL